jgi:cell filamentation protein
MIDLENGPLRKFTPCLPKPDHELSHALAVVHGELILIHPFRDGNGRVARLLALLMALQSGLPPLDFSPMAGDGKAEYINAIHAIMDRDYAPLALVFAKVIELSRMRDASSR